MDFFFCLPVLFGCPTKYKVEGSEGPRICPRCRNASVTSAKARTWLEICFVPLVPMSSKNVWICSICNWEYKQGDGFEPTHPGQPQYGGQQWGVPPQQQWGGQPQYGSPVMQYGQAPNQHAYPGQYRQPGYHQ